MRVKLARSIFELFTKEGRNTSVSDLKREGVQNVTILGADQLSVLIERALDRALEQRVLEMSAPEKARLLERAQQEFETLRAELQGLEGEAAKKREELTSLEGRISTLHKDFESANASMDAELLAAARMESATRVPEPDVAVLVNLMMQSGVASTAVAERAARAIAEHLRREREIAAQSAAAEQRARVELLERRLAKLNETLAKTEADLEDALQNSNREEGVASIYKTVQGLRASARDFEKKRALLSELFQKNLTLQKGAAGSQEPRTENV